jgi:hypothetical protein
MTFQVIDEIYYISFQKLVCKMHVLYVCTWMQHTSISTTWFRIDEELSQQFRKLLSSERVKWCVYISILCSWEDFYSMFCDKTVTENHILSDHKFETGCHHVFLCCNLLISFSRSDDSLSPNFVFFPERGFNSKPLTLNGLILLLSHCGL